MLEDLVHTPPWEWPSNAQDRITAALAADDRSLRLTAAGLAHHVMSDELAKALLAIAASKDEDEEVRGRAAIALGPALEECDLEGFDDPIGEPPLSEPVFEHICTALERLYREASASSLVRRYALEAAVRARREWQTAAIRAAWASGDPSWRATAAFCMGYAPDFDRELEEAFGSKDAAIVGAAMRGAAGGGKELTRSIEEQIMQIVREHRDPALVLDAIEALASGQTAESLELLEELTGSDDEEIAELAYEALAVRGAMPNDLDDDDF